MPTSLPPSRDFLTLPGRQRTRWVVLLGSLVAVVALTLDLYLPAFPQVRTDLATSANRVQLTLTGALIGAALGQLVAGATSDALGRRVALFGGLGLHVLASAGCALAPSIEVLGALRVLQGLGAAAASVTALAVVRDLFDGAGASRLLARLLLVLGVSPILAPSLGGWLLTVTTWRGIFVVLGLAAAVLVVVAAIALPETLPRERRRPPGLRATAATYRTLLGDRATGGLVLTAGMTNSMLFSYVTGAPFVLQGLYALSAQQFALVIALTGACFVAGTQVTAQLVATWSPQRLLVLGLGGAMVTALALLVDAGVHHARLPEVIALVGLITAFTGVAVPTTAAMVLERNGWAAGSAAALVGCSQFGLGAAVLPLVGLVGLRADLTMALSIGLAAAVGLLLLGTVVNPALVAQRPAPAVALRT